ncbi:MAG: ribosome silencing factor [Ignavibacteriales bacterium]|nr:ribosome silencing factor [Ignavibacteriales bacterium]
MLAKMIAGVAISKKARNVVLMDLRKKSSATDFFVVCSADSDVQVKSIADAIRDGLEMNGVSMWHSEGLRALQWVLLDYVDVVVHVFHKDVRAFYNLERLWSDAKIHPVEDTGTSVKILPPLTPQRIRTRPTKPIRRVSGSKA